MLVNEIEKKYYTIGEVADLFGVTTSLIRYWEKRFKQLNPQKSRQGIRKYAVSDLEQFKVIYKLIKQQGYTIKGAQEALKIGVYSSSPTHQLLIENLQELKDFLKLLQENV